MKSDSSPSAPITPSAPYLAPVSSHDDTTIWSSTWCMSRAELMAMTASSSTCALWGRAPCGSPGSGSGSDLGESSMGTS